MSSQNIRCSTCIKNCGSNGKSMRNKNCNKKNNAILLNSALENDSKDLSTSDNVPLEPSTQQYTENNDDNCGYEELLAVIESEIIPKNPVLQSMSKRDIDFDYIIKYKELETIKKHIELQKNKYYYSERLLRKLAPSYMSENIIKKSKAVIDCLNTYGPRGYYALQPEAYKTLPPILDLKSKYHSEDIRILFCQKIASLFITVMAKENLPNQNLYCNNCCKLYVDEKRKLTLKSLQHPISGPKLSAAEMFSLCVEECKKELIDTLNKNNNMLDYELQLINNIKDILLKKLQIDYRKEIINNKFEKLNYDIELLKGQKCPDASYLLNTLIIQRDEYIEQFDELEREFSDLNLDLGLSDEINSFNNFLVQQQMDQHVVEEDTSVNKCLTEHKECAVQSYILSEILSSDTNGNGKNIKADEEVTNGVIMVKDLSIIREEFNQSKEDGFNVEELD